MELPQDVEVGEPLDILQPILILVENLDFALGVSGIDYIPGRGERGVGHTYGGQSWRLALHS
jgi:hypothetical protein